MERNCDVALISASCSSGQVKEHVFGDLFLNFFHHLLLSSVAIQIFGQGFNHFPQAEDTQTTSSSFYN
jgi:hypothetical protein